MSERYSRLFTLPENLYAIGSPVVIAAGTLLKDNQTGRIVAQLKLKSISSKAIKAVKVKLYLFDTAGNSLEESVVHDYLDLNVSRDTEFGQKNPVMVPNIKARSYKASVIEVVFGDRSVWTANTESWEPLSKPSLLVFDDPELQKQYQIKFGRNSKYEPKSEKDLWYCTCGTLNRDDEICYICHSSRLELQAMDIAKLSAEKDARLREEAGVAAEKARQEAEKKAEREAATREAKRKTKKLLKIATLAVCSVIAVVLIITKVVIPSGKYKDAVALMDAGKYRDAIAAFDALNGFKDSEEQITNCENAIFAEAEALLAAGDYDTAISIYESFLGYENGSEGISAEKSTKLEVAYKAAEALSKCGAYDEAYKAFSTLKDYKDSKAKASFNYNEYKSEKRNNTTVGDYTFFGSYEQDGDKTNGKEELEWLILDKQEDKILLISRYALDGRPYHPKSVGIYGRWSGSTIRTWLNNEFFNDAFSADEQVKILKTTVSEENNPEYAIDPGQATEDRIFLLSIAEAEKYFASNESRMCIPTDYAMATGAYSSDTDFIRNSATCWWWLRSPSTMMCFVACVDCDGSIEQSSQTSGSGAIRPALWISLP